MSHIQASRIRVAYDQNVILEDLSAAIPDGAITTIIGANGCGKSTLLKALTRVLPIQAGQVLLDGQAIASLPTKQVAQRLALLPQILEAPEGITVYELVSYGRYPHQSGLGFLSPEDKEKVDWALDMTQTTHLSSCLVDSLSGGQRQCVWIAMALAQDTPTIFLDEPTTYLDLNHQLEVLELLKRLNQEMGKTIVMVLHDLNLSARFSDHLLAMKDGQLRHHGTVKDIMTPPILQEIFQIDAQIVQAPDGDYPILLTYTLTHS